MLTIREALPSDAPRLVEIYSYYVERTAISFEYETPSVEEFTRRISTIKQRYPYLVLEKDGVIRGYAYASAFKGRSAYDWSVELSIYIEKGQDRKGYGRKLYEELEKRLKAQGILNLYACIAYPEKEDEYLTRNSVDFHAHLGFKTVGLYTRCGYKFNRWYSMVWMEKLIGEHGRPEIPAWLR